MKLSIKESSKTLKQDEIIKAYERLFSSRDGAVVLEDLASLSGMYRSNFVQNNKEHTFFLEGQRSLFLYICSQLSKDEVSNIKGS